MYFRLIKQDDANYFLELLDQSDPRTTWQNIGHIQHLEEGWKVVDRTDIKSAPFGQVTSLIILLLVMHYKYFIKTELFNARYTEIFLVCQEFGQFIWDKPRGTPVDDHLYLERILGGPMFPDYKSLIRLP